MFASVCINYEVKQENNLQVPAGFDTALPDLPVLQIQIREWV